jgi:hypothetical protein
MHFDLSDPVELDGYLFVDGDFPRLPMLERGFIVVALDPNRWTLA